jgi:hypothetical protein
MTTARQNVLRARHADSRPFHRVLMNVWYCPLRANQQVDDSRKILAPARNKQSEVRAYGICS